MDFSYKNDGPYMVISTKFVFYSLARRDVPELYLDRKAALELARTIDRITPRPWILQGIYYSFERQRQPGFVYDDDAFIARLSSSILKRIKLRSGRDLYLINKSDVQQFTERADLEWRVTYEPGEEFDVLTQEIEQYLRENTETLQWMLNSNMFSQQQSSYIQDTAMAPQPLYVSPQQVYQPQQPVFQSAPVYWQTPACPQQQHLQQQSLPLDLKPMPQQALHSASVKDSVRRYHQTASALASQSPGFESIPETARFSQEDTVLESGCPSPVEGPGLTDELDAFFRGIENQSARLSAPNPFVSQFELAEKQAVIDKEAAEKILRKMKVLALNPKMTKSSPHRHSIQSEKEAIKSMTINTSLNIPSAANSTIVQKMERLFKQYDVNDEEGNESFQRALLMIAVTLLRHEFLYQNGKKQPGNYASDFEKVYPLPAGFLRKAGHLCRIVVACGHPCIVVVLVRLAVRNRMTLSTLLEQLPITHFCKFVTSGKVTDLNNHSSDTIHDDLKWLHTNVLLPLLHAASRRVQDQLSLVNGSLICDQDSCLRAIVHHKQQVKYTDFLNGYHTDAAWARGRVLLENRNTARDTEAEYSIERDQRTVSQYDLNRYSHTDHFLDPPKFMQNKILDMSLDG